VLIFGWVYVIHICLYGNGSFLFIIFLIWNIWTFLVQIHPQIKLVVFFGWMGGLQRLGLWEMRTSSVGKWPKTVTIHWTVWGMPFGYGICLAILDALLHTNKHLQSPMYDTTMDAHTQIHMQQLGRGCGSLEWLNLLFVYEEKTWENQTNRTPEVRGSLYPKSDGEHISSIPTFFVTLPACWPPGPLSVLHSENDLIFQLPC